MKIDGIFFPLGSAVFDFHSTREEEGEGAEEG